MLLHLNVFSGSFYLVNFSYITNVFMFLFSNTPKLHRKLTDNDERKMSRRNIILMIDLSNK